MAYRVLLGLQVVTALWAALMFKYWTDPRIAGVLAGSGFILIGLCGAWTGFKGLRGPDGRGARPVGLAALILAVLHLGVFAVPMLAYRIANWETAFSSIEFWGLRGPEFHIYSTRYYSFWMLFCLVVAVFEWLKGREARGVAKDLAPKE